MADPGYPCNEVFALLTGATPVRIPAGAEVGFQLAPAQVRDAWGERTRALLLASPANPTGVVLERGLLGELAQTVREAGGHTLLDEIYQGLVYDAGPGYRTGLEISDDLFVLNSFSKYFGMTGWRLGWMVVPDLAVDGLRRLAQNLFISPSSIAQHAALAAFDDEALAVHEERRGVFARRRDRLAAGLANLGLDVPVRPAGAFYLYADVSPTGLDSYEFCWRLIDEFKVAVTPGIDFGDHLADRFVRFAYTTGEADIDVGLERLGAALDAWGCACA
jgi:aspartate/methionine/tyrosine aminotransferase